MIMLYFIPISSTGIFSLIVGWTKQISLQFFLQLPFFLMTVQFDVKLASIIFYNRLLVKVTVVCLKRLWCVYNKQVIWTTNQFGLVWSWNFWIFREFLVLICIQLAISFDISSSQGNMDRNSILNLISVIPGYFNFLKTYFYQLVICEWETYDFDLWITGLWINKLYLFCKFVSEKNWQTKRQKVMIVKSPCECLY